MKYLIKYWQQYIDKNQSYTKCYFSSALQNLKTRPGGTKAFLSNITVSLNKPQEYYRITKIPHKQVGKFTMSAILPKITIHAKKKTESKISSSINQSINQNWCRINSDDTVSTRPLKQLLQL